MGNNNSVKRTAAALGGVCFFFLNVILPLNIWAGIFIDSNLSWKCHVDYISRKVKRSIIGLLSKLRCYVSRDTLINKLLLLFNIPISNLGDNRLGKYLYNFP